MAIQVSLIKEPAGISESKVSHLFGDDGGTLGRADSNHWPLPDPDRFLSSCHCEILSVSGRYYLLDRSTNGTFLNGSTVPIGKGLKSELTNGDTFEIGDYRFSVSFINVGENLRSPFERSDSGFGHQAIDTGFTEPLSRDSASGASLFDRPMDPLALWDSVGKHEPRAGNLGRGERTGLLSGDIPAPFQGYKQVDLSPGIDQSIVWPETKNQNLIPENWEDDPVDLDDRLNLAASTKPGPFANVDRDINLGRQDFSATLSGDSARLHGGTALHSAGVAPEAFVQKSVQEFASQPRAPASLPAAPPPTNKSASPAAPNSPSVPASESAADCIFIASLGLDPKLLSASDIAEISALSGELMREIVDGMMSVLRSRASIKNEFRMNVTTIQPVENNPLKFSACVDDALENIFLKKSKAYKKPLDAFREGFQEIAEHQVAMIGGIREGFDRMMERFDPVQLEKVFNRKGRANLIPSLQKAKYWSSYTEYYSELTDNRDYSFQQLFGSDFVTAYENHLRRLATTRKGKPNNDER